MTVNPREKLHLVRTPAPIPKPVYERLPMTGSHTVAGAHSVDRRASWQLRYDAYQAEKTRIAYAQQSKDRDP